MRTPLSFSVFIIYFSCAFCSENASIKSSPLYLHDNKAKSTDAKNRHIPEDKDVKFRDHSSRNYSITEEKACIEDWLQQNELTVRNAARILLLSSPRDVSDVLKQNPLDRNNKLIKLMYKNFNGKLLMDVLKFDLHLVQDTFTQPDIDLKIKNLFEKHDVVDVKLDELSLLLSDFLSLKTDDIFQDESDDVIEGEIRKLLYSSPETIEEVIKLYIEENDYDVPIDNLKDNVKNGRTLFNCYQNKNDKTVSAVNTNDETESAETEQTSAEFDKSIIPVQTVEDRDRTEEEIKVKDVEETSFGIKGLHFLDVPDGDDMRIQNMKIEEENFVFAVFSSLVSYLQPKEFPLGLLKDAFRKHVSLHILILQILKLEGLVLCWVLFWAILSLCLPFAVVAQICCPRRNMQRLRDDASSSVSANLNNKCSGKAAVSILYILMVSLLCTILLMLVSNDKFSRAIERSPTTAAVIFKDLETFIKNTGLQISFVATSSFEITIDQISGDLQDIGKLLGESFKKDFIAETEFDEVINGLVQLKSGSTEISKRVKELLRECNVAKGAGKLLQEDLVELSNQLNMTRRYCTQKDRNLCQSLQSTGLQLAFTVDELLADPDLQYLERIKYDNKFNSSIDETVELIKRIPRHIELETSSQRAGILDVLQVHRSQMYNSVRSLEDLSRSMIISVDAVAQDVLLLLENVAARDLWRYLLVVGTSFIIFLTWVLFVCGSPCCCYYKRKTIPFLQLGLTIICILSMVLWISGSIAYIIGGHGQAIICNPLYEDNFIILSNILDKDGMTYKEGYFTHFLKTNESLKTEEILRNCQRNQPSYTTFRLQNRLDVPKIFNYQSWQDLKMRFDQFSFTTKNLKISTPNLDKTLEDCSISASKNKFRDLRSKISLPITHKDLNTFYDQLYSVAKQIADTKSATTIEKVMFKTQAIIDDKYKVVQNHRDSILYRLTALEILLKPLNVKIENYQLHLFEAQIFLEENGEILAEKNTKNYIFRLEHYLRDLQKHTTDQIRRNIGKCKPIWDLFFHTRHHICKEIMEPVNTLSVSYFLTILIFLCLTPITINLIVHYRDMDVNMPESNGRFGQDLNMRDEAIWTTPQSGTPARNSFPNDSPPNDKYSSQRLRPTSPPTNTVIPTPPRSKYDPLKFIERTRRISRSVQSPKGWL